MVNFSLVFSNTCSAIRAPLPSAFLISNCAFPVPPEAFALKPTAMAVSALAPYTKRCANIVGKKNSAIGYKVRNVKSSSTGLNGKDEKGAKTDLNS